MLAYLVGFFLHIRRLFRLLTDLFYLFRCAVFEFLRRNLYLRAHRNRITNSSRMSATNTTNDQHSQPDIHRF